MGTNLIVFISGFLGGILFHSFFDLSYYFSLFWLLVGGSIFAYSLLFNIRIRRVFTVALFLVSIGLGLLRYDISDFYKGNLLLDNFVGKEIKALAFVSEEPDEREFNTRLIISFQKLFIENGWIEINSKAIISVDQYPVFSYGDEVEIVGILKKPENFENENGREFNYVAYLAKDGIFYQMSNPKIKLVSRDKGNLVKEKLFAIKNAFLKSVQKIIPEPHSALLGGLVVGAKESLGKNLLDAFRKTGIIHIVVLSGYNITIVAEAIMRAFSFLPRFVGISLGSLSVIFFAIMTGASATIVRASIMALLVILARATGRVYEITMALCLAGFVMVLHNPKILIFDPGFQLSFLATIGLIYLAPKIEKYFKFVPTEWGFKEFAIATVSTQIFVLPLIMYQTGELSLVSLPVNLLILVFVPATMLFGFLSGVVGFISTLFAMPFAFVAYALLAYQLKVVEIFSSLSFSSVHIEFFPLWLALAIYAVYVFMIYKMQKNASKQ